MLIVAFLNLLTISSQERELGVRGWVSLAGLNVNVSLFKKCCLIIALDGTEYIILWDSSDLDCPELRGGLGEVDLELDTMHRSEEDIELTDLFIVLKIFSFFFGDLCLLIQRHFLSEY